MRPQRGRGLLELDAQLIHPDMMVGRPAESARTTLAGVLRLTGLPSPSRYPRATVSQGEGRLEILFSGAGDATRVDVDLRLLGPVEDLEAVQLDLLARLQELGYETRWERDAGDSPA
ncbi:MAG: hypothetical protein QOG35_2846 [Solirubrobacteraceae bacterium]|nr:hypothetical protein [Solirubrobacteraceae bacterium]